MNNNKTISGTDTNSYDFSKNASYNSHSITCARIMHLIKDTSLFPDIIIKKSVTSTNSLLKDMAKEGAPSGTVLIAEEQTAGRGRLGRSFHSPNCTGIYLSILLRPTMPANESLFLTTSAAVAVAKSIEDISNNTALIKWVNDVYVNERKVCGILTEGSINTNGNLDYAIVGIGINVWTPTNDFPDDIKNIAGSIFGDHTTYSQSCSTKVSDVYTSIAPSFSNEKEKLIASVLNHFMEYYINFPDKPFLKEYKKRSFLIGKKIYIIENNNRTPATALDIDNECHLIVQLENGEIKKLSSGEVSIKLS